jgi:hypothetical protein
VIVLVFGPPPRCGATPTRVCRRTRFRHPKASTAAVGGSTNASWRRFRTDVARTQELLSEHVRGAQVYAVCPIPLYATWLDRHIVDANGRSKALLRAAIELELAGNSIYLPLWDWMQAQTGRWSPTRRDGRHLDRTGINRIMLFAERYLGAAPVPELPLRERMRAGAADALDRLRRRG